ncbi:elongation factor EF-2, partial [archaeon]|nr:elongation factor EF-2 [archaeon]
HREHQLIDLSLEEVKLILFINKVDRLMKELQLTPEVMQERFMKIIASVNKLIKDIAEEEYGSKWAVNVQDGSVCFGSAFHNWAMSLDYMQKKNISFKEIIDAYDNETWTELKKKAPLHEVLLNAVIKHHPNPVDAQKYRIPKIWHGDKESALGKSLLSCNPNGKLAFVVVKVVVDPQAGEIAAGRLFSGTLKKGMPIYMNIRKTALRSQQIYVYNGAKREVVDNVPSGNIVGLGGLKDAYPGETITDEADEPFEKITHIFEPVITKSIEAKNPADLPDLAKILVQVSKEDPSLQIYINQETGEYLMSGMGELHLEIIENRIKDTKHLDIQTSAPIVVYRETITAPSGAPFEGKSPNKHNKLYFTVEPVTEELKTAIKEGKIPAGRIKKKDMDLWESLEAAGMDSKQSRKVRDIFNGNILVDGTRGIVHIGEVIEMIMDMFEDVMKAGAIAREPCLNIKVTINDMKLHEDAIHRGPAQFYPAVRMGIRGAMSQAKPSLYEPIQTMRFEAPIAYMGEISKLIANKRGQLIDMKQEGETVIVLGKLPVGEMFGMSSELRSATGGRGISSLVDQNFERLPDEIQHTIVTRIRQRKGLKADEDHSE